MKGSHVKIEADTRVIKLHDKECQGLPITTEEAWKISFQQSFAGTTPAAP